MNEIAVFCATGLLFLPGGIPGLMILFFTDQWVDFSLKYSAFFVLYEQKRTDNYRNLLVIFNKIFGTLLIFISLLPTFFVFYRCVLLSCRIN